MKVILLQDVKKLGKKNDIVKVADGYGQNYLIKNHLAILATEHGKEMLEKLLEVFQQKMWLKNYLKNMILRWIRENLLMLDQFRH